MKFKVAALIGLEVGLLTLAFASVGMWGASHSSLGMSPSPHVLGQALLVIFCLVASFYYNDLYDLRIVRNFSDFCVQGPQALGVVVVLLAIIWTVFPSLRVEGTSSLSTIGRLLFTLSLVFPIRAVWYGLLRHFTFAERVVILGTSPIAQKIVAEVGAVAYAGYQILGYVHDRSEGLDAKSALAGYRSLGPLDELRRILAESEPDRVIVALTERRGRLPVRDLLDARMSGITVEDGVEVLERLTGKLAIESLNPSYLFFSKDFTVSRVEMILQRLVSLTVSLCGLVFMAPVMILIAIAIKLDSKGPVFFVQARAGLRGVPFRLVKFRTMHPAAAEENEGEKEAAEQSVWNRDSISRVTRVGRVLRNLRLDELPQFFNILRGDMDIVGPRPEMLANVKTMSERIPYYSLRMGVRPGLTGWAQVRHSYAVSEEDVTEKMRYDLYYLKHMSLWLDLKILLDTVKIVVTGHGSEQRVPAQRLQ